MRAKKLSAIVAIILIISSLFAFAACDGKEVALEGIELSRGTMTLDVGDSETLEAVAIPAGAAPGTVTWISSDPSVASVNGGVVTALKEGSAIIRATAGGKSADCRVTVTDSSKQEVTVTAIVLDPTAMELQLGKTLSAKIDATVLPVNASDKSLEWSTDSASIATVDNEGLVTAVSSGICTITCTSSNNISARCRVTVKKEDGTVDQGLYVAKVAELSERDEAFHMVMDASAVPSLEAAGVTYKDFDGQVKDVFQILKNNGITDIRVRVWNDPKTEKGEWYGGGNCDINNAVTIAKRCKDAELGVILDFHYSDFWADPGKQTLPKAWKNFNSAQIETAIYDFTLDSLNKVVATGADVTMVQIGNETNGFFCGSKDWATICRYFNQGIAAVREATGEVEDGGAKAIIHFANPESADYVSRADELNRYGVDYDVFGSSYYPYWHGTLDNLKTQLKGVHDKYNKEVMVMETSYAFTNEDADGFGNTSSTPVDYPLTVQGQTNQVRDVINAVASLGDYALGVAYWEGTWIAATTSPVGSVNVAKCKEFGCGWASKVAGEYDNSVTNDGACVIDNQAFWLSDGTPLQSLKVFKLVYEGQNVTLTADYIESQDIFYTVGVGSITLPATAKVSFNSGGAAQDVNVIWDCSEAQLDEYINKVGTYTIQGTTEYGGVAIVNVWVMNENMLKNASFEDGKGYPQTDYLIQSAGEYSPWHVSFTKATGKLQLYVSNESQNARMGTQSFHFWDEGVVKFTLFQTLTAEDLEKYGNGKFGASFDVQGGDGANVDIHAYVTITHKDGSKTTVDGEKIGLNGWKNWTRTAVSGVQIDLDDILSVEVGISVYAEVSGSGPWGNIDNCQFYFEE